MTNLHTDTHTHTHTHTHITRHNYLLSTNTVTVLLADK